MAESNFVKIGPAGKYGTGEPWDERGKSEIVQIFIWHNNNGIRAIQFHYSGENENLVLSDKHGGIYRECNYGGKFDVVQLDHPSEYITRISGFVSSKDGIVSLKFGTNRGEYGPLGHSEDNSTGCSEFCFQLGEGRQFGGFHGKTDDLGLVAIGVYLKPSARLSSSTLKEKKLNTFT